MGSEKRPLRTWFREWLSLGKKLLHILPRHSLNRMPCSVVDTLKSGWVVPHDRLPLSLSDFEASEIERFVNVHGVRRTFVRLTPNFVLRTAHCESTGWDPHELLVAIHQGVAV